MEHTSKLDKCDEYRWECKQILMLILMWQSCYYNLVVLNVKAKLKPPSLTIKGSGLLIE
jgi:hypothetical protein